MSGIDHLGFIVAAYAATGLVLLGTMVVLFLDARAQKQMLARYEGDRTPQS